ncbi:MAG: Bifunctional folate synthesis protein [candidate division WS2 bacterium]|uniref:2-amino-4-hydroxy-6-hydroxymethyldihydropteridine diphosphokinase n=1 Tax=Psychracetigena formicireducens TaxID=2986056 RepID=A0A9E2F2U4_PSYF1|nr:Bifunctional folate synthesis protein [Candidatus Psychracetigena formicireducens]
MFHVIVNIENSLGRKRNNRKYTSRTIDIDILFYENEVMFSETLVIPHPRIRERKFVLEPLNELIPQYIHPVEKKTIRQLFLECNDQLEVKRFGNNQSYLSPKAKSPASPIPGTI